MQTTELLFIEVRCQAENGAGKFLAGFGIIRRALAADWRFGLMRARTGISALLVVLVGLFACDEDSSSPHNPAGADSTQFAVIQTTMGDITIELFPEKAPLTVANFRRYASERFYDGLIFHRVIPNFMNQGGGFTPDMILKA